MNNCGIYCIENKINNKKYIGQSVSLKKRISNHLWALDNNKHFNEHLQKSWNKYGKQNFNVYVLCYCDKDKLDNKEIYYINYYKTTNKKFGYNKDSGGNKNKTRSEEFCNKMRDYWKTNWNTNNGLLEATVKARKEVVQFNLSGKVIENYTSIIEASAKTGINFKQISAVCTGRHKSAGGFVWRFANDNFNKFDTSRKNIGKKIIQYTIEHKFVKEYSSIAEAGRKTGFNTQNISSVCNGKRKTANGYLWEFAF